MPELPETETMARQVTRLLTGATLGAPVVAHPGVLRDTSVAQLVDGTTGARIAGAERRAKLVSVLLDRAPEVGGPGDGAGLGRQRLVFHPKMTGAILVVGAEDPAPGHAVVTWPLDDGRRLVWRDIRRFGTVRLLDEAAWATLAAQFGPEPLERTFTARALAAAVGGTRRPIKAALLDPARLAGVGNIYAAEAFHAAGLWPGTPANSLDADQWQTLWRETRRILRAAVAAGGTTARDYVGADGRAGRFATQLHVYGRAGQPCTTCQGILAQDRSWDGRSTVWCPTCQPAPTAPTGRTSARTPDRPTATRPAPAGRDGGGTRGQPTGRTSARGAAARGRGQPASGR